MASDNWTREEVEATVADYLAMLADDLAGRPYNKAEHNRRLIPLLRKRSGTSIEFKHANISAILIEHGFPYIGGYKPRSNYQKLLMEVVLDRLSEDQSLHELAATVAVQRVPFPSVKDILKVLTNPPEPVNRKLFPTFRISSGVNYLELEAANRALGMAGEKFALAYEKARLISIGCEKLARRIEHVSVEVGDGAGYDIRSFEANGSDRLIEVKTTKHGNATPFFVSRNEVRSSEVNSDRYHLYRLFAFKVSPRLFTLQGALTSTCSLDPTNFVATVTRTD